MIYFAADGSLTYAIALSETTPGSMFTVCEWRAEFSHWLLTRKLDFET
jgi:hypothetical protein